MAVLKNESHKLLVLNRYGSKCAYCGIELTRETLCVDHFIPRRRGVYPANVYHRDYKKEKGSNGIENLMPACGSCNSSKHDWTIDEWRFELNLRLQRLRKNSSEYRTALRFGMITENTTPITFYFEKHG